MVGGASYLLAIRNIYRRGSLEWPRPWSNGPSNCGLPRLSALAFPNPAPPPSDHTTSSSGAIGSLPETPGNIAHIHKAEQSCLRNASPFPNCNAILLFPSRRGAGPRTASLHNQRHTTTKSHLPRRRDSKPLCSYLVYGMDSAAW